MLYFWYFWLYWGFVPSKDCSITFKGSSIWNSLLKDAKNCTSVPNFQQTIENNHKIRNLCNWPCLMRLILRIWRYWPEHTSTETISLSNLSSLRAVYKGMRKFRKMLILILLCNRYKVSSLKIWHENLQCFSKTFVTLQC